MPPSSESTKKSSGKPLTSTGIGSMVTADESGNLTIPASVREMLTLERARAAASSVVPQYPQYHVPDLPDGVVSDAVTGYARIGWAMLRRFREQNPLCKQILSSRHRSAARHSQLHDGRRDSVGFKVVHQDHFKQGAETPSYMPPFIKRAEDLIRSPSPGRWAPTTESLVVPLVEDLLVINRPTVEVMNVAGKPYDMAGIRPVDGAIILERAEYIQFFLNQAARVETHRSGDKSKETREAQRYIDLDPEVAATFVSEQTNHDIYGAEYVLVRNGIVEGTYSPGRIYMNPLRTRTDILYTPYHPSPLEDALEIIAAFWETWDRENVVFREGMWADTLLLFEAIDKQQYLSVLQQIREAGQGYHRSNKPITVHGLEASKVHKVELKSPPSEMQFAQRLILCANMVCSVFAEHPSSINWPEFQGGARSPLNERDRSEEIDATKWDGHKTDMKQVASLLTRVVREKIHPELMIICEFGEYDAMQQARLHEVRVKTTHSRNELRVADGDPPHGFYLTSEEYEKASDKDKALHDQNPWNYPDSPTFMQQAQALAAAAQAGQGQSTDDGVPAQVGPAAGAPAQKKTDAGAVEKKSASLEKGRRMDDLFVPLEAEDWQTY